MCMEMSIGNCISVQKLIPTCNSTTKLIGYLYLGTCTPSCHRGRTRKFLAIFLIRIVLRIIRQSNRSNTRYRIIIKGFSNTRVLTKNHKVQGICFRVVYLHVPVCIFGTRHLSNKLYQTPKHFVVFHDVVFNDNHTGHNTHTCSIAAKCR